MFQNLHSLSPSSLYQSLFAVLHLLSFRIIYFVKNLLVVLFTCVFQFPSIHSSNQTSFSRSHSNFFYLLICILNFLFYSSSFFALVEYLLLAFPTLPQCTLYFYYFTKIVRWKKNFVMLKEAFVENQISRLHILHAAPLMTKSEAIRTL